MSTPLINILIRTHRKEMFDRCIKSVMDCGYNNVALKVYDGTGKGNNYEYNLICNEMKADVEDGYFFFLDDDDILISGALSKITEQITDDTPIICQMLRNGAAKPAINVILRGHIGMPCMILHHSHKYIADVTSRQCGDYDWIKAVTDKLGYKWVPVPLVDAGSRSHGK